MAHSDVARSGGGTKGSSDASITGSLGVILLYLGLAKIVGAAKEVVLAAHYGTGPALDAYALLFSLANAPVSIWTNTAAMVLVPVFVRLGNEASESRQEFFSECFGATLILGFGVAIFYMCMLGLGLSRGVLGLSGRVTAEASQMYVCFAVMIPAGMVSGFLATPLMAGRRNVNSLLEAVPSLALIATVVMIDQRGSVPLQIGTALGFAVWPILLLLAQPNGTNALRLRVSFRSKVWREVLGSGAVLLIAQAIFSVSAGADQIIASHLGPGSNAAVGYANRLLMLLSSLTALAVARAILPVLAQARLSDPGEEIRLARRWAAVLFVLGVVGIAIGGVLAHLGVELLFQRGSFTANDTAEVTKLFQYGLLQLPFYVAGTVLAQLAASRRQYTAFLVVNGVSLVVKLVAAVLLADAFGAKGVMLATALMYASSMIALAVLAHRPYRGK